MKGKFDEFGIILMGAVIFMGILAFGFTTPSEFPPKITPEKVSLDVDPGTIETFVVNISARVSQANISASGPIAEWVTFSRTDLGATGSKGEKVTVTVDVPENAKIGTHKGKIVVKAKEGEDSLDLTVAVAPIKRLVSRTVPLEDFSVRYVKGENRVLESRDKAWISRSYLNENELRMVVEADPAEIPVLKNANIRFNVDDATNFGPLVILQNGVKIFDENVGEGEVVVPLNVSGIEDVNTIKMQSGSPGIFFWADNVYQVSNVQIDAKFDGSIPKNFQFRMSPEEQTRFDHLQLSYVVRGSSSSLPPLKVQFNDQVIYFTAPVKTSFNQNVDRDIFGGKLVAFPTNNLTFSFEQPGSYDVSEAAVTFYTKAN